MRTFLILAAILGSTTVAAANPRAQADAYARRGVALYNLGKYDDAIVAFEQAYTLFQSDALLFNLAQAHRQLEHCDKAVDYYKRFMDGEPAPALAAQVESLLPKLEAACRTKHERPKGPVAAIAPGTELGTTSPVAAAKEPLEAAPDATVVKAAKAAPQPVIIVTSGLTAGTVISGGTAPTAGVKLTVTTSRPWSRGGELGVAIGAGRMWRGDTDHNATLASIAATVRVRSVFDWGRFTIGGEVGAAYFSSLDTSSGVVPGITRVGQWAPQARAEIGAEHDVAHSLALRVAVAVGMCPRTGGLLNPIGQLDLLLGLRYSR